MVFTVVMGTSTPLFVVSSGSMKPTLDIGDLIVVRDGGTFSELKVGDIITFHSPSSPDRVIVHRVYRIVQARDGSQGVMTKGDNNSSPDGWAIEGSNYVGKVIFSIPKLGYVSAVITPPLNYVLIAVILGFIFLSEFYPSKQKQYGAA